LRIDLSCNECGCDSFSLDAPASDSSTIYCDGCGRLIGTIGELKTELGRAILRRSTASNDNRDTREFTSFRSKNQGGVTGDKGPPPSTDPGVGDRSLICGEDACVRPIPKAPAYIRVTAVAAVVLVGMICGFLLLANAGRLSLSSHYFLAWTVAGACAALLFRGAPFARRLALWFGGLGLGFFLVTLSATAE
jgi:hypothetical protein